MDRTSDGDARSWPRVFAWGVHLFTASGAVVGAAALLWIGSGALRSAAACMLAALAIDSLDGTLARTLRVGERVPGIDGRRLDDIVDYLNYVIVPGVFLVADGRLVHPAWVAAPILASALGFAQREAKTPDDFFLGFPSYWNLVALYAWLLDVPAGPSTALVVTLSAAVLVPWKYAYLSRMRQLRRTTAVGAALWGGMLTTAVLAPERATPLRLAEISLFFPVYYVALSVRYGGWARAGPGHSPQGDRRVPRAVGSDPPGRGT